MKHNKYPFFYKKYLARKTIKKLLAECGIWKRTNNYYMLSKTLRLIHYLENKYNLGGKKTTGEIQECNYYYRTVKWHKFDL